MPALRKTDSGIEEVPDFAEADCADADVARGVGSAFEEVADELCRDSG